MSGHEQEILAASRPRGFSGRGDKYLAEIARDLRRRLLKAQEGFAYPTCRLHPAGASQLAAALVEFAEDIHADIGLWRSVEAHNAQCFDTPLPFLVAPGDATPLAPFDCRRVQHLLWTLLPCLIPDTVLSPTHQDLRRMAEAVSEFLTGRFARMPQDSGVKQFLATDNRYGWDIKRKLVWLGTQSYLFRFLFQNYLDEHNEPRSDIATVDDFICQECTVWSGLGVLDVLAGALELPEDDRATLRSWYERHTAFYRVLTQQESRAETEFITARNIVNEQTYTVRMHMPNCPFRPGLLVFGALTPWRGEWYWSGEQRTYGETPEREEAGLRKEMLEKSSGIAYRYCPALAERARESARVQHAKFVAHHGNDLVVFADGLSLAAAEQKRMEAEWQAAPREHVERLMLARGLSRPRPSMSFPPDFLQHEEGIGAFTNPTEGVEYLLRFHHVLGGLRKKGAGLTEDESDALRHTVTDPAVSPAFVQRLVAEHGRESIAQAFLLRDQPPELALDFLLRCHKGEHFRRRYPAISLVDSDQSM